MSTMDNNLGKTIQAAEVADLIRKDAFKTVSFIYDLNNNPNNFLVIYKTRLAHQELNASSFYDKIAQVCQLEGLGFIVYGDSDTAKVAKAQIKQAIPKVDEVIIDPRKKKGVIECEGYVQYNKYCEPKAIKELKAYADSLKKEQDIFDDVDFGAKTSKPKQEFKTADEHFDWSTCELWKYHMTRLADPKLNEAKDAEGNDVNSFEYLLKWIAHTLKSDQKIGVAMMLISETHGTGKGIAVDKLLFDTLGSDYASKVTNETFVKEHNAIIRSKKFLNYDESKVDGKNRTVVEEKLKTLITENKAMVRAMQKDQEEVASFCNIWVNANYGVPYKLSNSDRRHTVFVTSAIPQKIAVRKDLGMRETEYLKLLDEQKDSFLKQLFTWDFDFADVRFNPLNTKAKRRIVSGTNTSFDLFCDLARKNDIAGIENILMGLFTEQVIDKIIDEVSGGYITNEVSKTVLEALRDSNGSMSPSQQKRFLDEKIGESERVNCGSKKVTLRKFPHFSKEIFEFLNSDETVF